MLSDMAASSSSASLFGIRGDQGPMMNPQQHSSTPSSSTTAAAPPQKKKRNQPGTPNPDAEVIALSPKTLMATNRFICEVCNKGFQREQNLQLHRRGHNLPWKLKQKTNKEPKRKVYLCPEPTCVHHDPSRALGDLTGIKKHYSRKHGEKKWKCEKCSKKYAVQSDWKAHSKTCGTREYRRDSFITHRAFCDALAQESARQPSDLISSAINGSQLYESNNLAALGLSQVASHISGAVHDHHPSNQIAGDILRLGGTARTGQFDHLLPPSLIRPPPPQMAAAANVASPPVFFMTEQSNQNYHHHDHHHQQNKQFHGLMQFSDLHHNNSNNSPTAAPNNTNLFNLPPFLSNTANNNNSPLSESAATGGGQIDGPNSFFSDQITSSSAPSLFSTSLQNNSNSSSFPPMSATALLQKAAQIGANSSNNSATASLLRSFGSSSSTTGSKSDHQHHRPPQQLVGANYGAIFGGSSTSTSTNNDGQNGNLQDLMNAFSSVGGYEGYDHRHHQQQQQNSSNTRDLKLPAGSDRLTRDFLGVGQIVRTMSGGISPGDHHQQQQQQGFMNLGSLETHRNNNNAAAPSGQSFGSGGNFQ
ncbi:protein indeterminate-domain 5, chloroplastic-like isoform X2 [Prosopis cineraria]|uniref:protein indeterminate-domain 5, chloroplastic-like isoform X2 n=1 Tax=Prosopis cineraria TaxID=364024 RepID=UPI00240F40A1|nr:protein indeterminate-domain 5, chloroplastic-like isoform X2 [Prosopis cineraria]